MWSLGFDARITKEEFNRKIEILNAPQSIANLFFTAKEKILSDVEEQERQLKRDSLFVKQIECINRRGKEHIILDAINDFLCYEREEAKIVKKGTIVSRDFETFLTNNESRWKEVFFSYITKETYSDEESNELAIKVYDSLMQRDIRFLDVHEINISNDYIKKGSFHKLADIPSIGWHPDWEKMFKAL